MKCVWIRMNSGDLIDRGCTLGGDTSLALYPDLRIARVFTFFMRTTPVNSAVFEKVSWFGEGHRTLGQRGAINGRRV